MKKTVIANISGIVFHIDEDAYEMLNTYLERIRIRLSADQGSEEIMADIESRIAEMFQDTLKGSKKVITIADVKMVKERLGEPEQFDEASETTEDSSKKNTWHNEKSNKRLFRDPDDKYIAGVAGGLANFFGLDPVWIRAAFIVFIFVYGFGPILYLILWIVVPKARTAAEKLEMKGEKVNLSNIEKTIKEEINDLKNNFKEFSEEAKEVLKKKEKTSAAVNRSNTATRNLVSVFAKAAGILLIIMAFSFLVAIISGIYMIPISLHLSHDIWLISVPEILSALLSSTLWVNLTMAALLVVAGLPILGMLMAGVQLLFDIRTSSKYLNVAFFMLWIAALGLLVIATLTGARNFSAFHTSRQEHRIPETNWPNLYLQVNNTNFTDLNLPRNRNQITTWQLLWQEREDYAMGMPELNIKTTTNNNTTLEVIRESRGHTPFVASANAAAISYNFYHRDSLLVLDPFFRFDKTDGWRNQKVELELTVPENKIVIIDKNLRRSMKVRWGNNANVVENQ